jgi:cell division protein FtsA
VILDKGNRSARKPVDSNGATAMLAQEEVAVPVGPSLRSDGTSRTAMETGIFAAIDVGTTKVCTILGRRNGKRGIQVLGHSTVPCSGLRKGNVTDVAATEEAVRESISQVEHATGHRIESAFVGITGSHVSFENRRDRLEAVGESGVITAGDLSRAPESLASAASDPGRRLLHAVRMSYALDGEEGIRNPLGMHSRDIEVETHVVTGGVAFINRLVRAVEKAGITVASLVLEPLASGLAVLTPEEKERGALLVDMGGGTTDVVGFRQGRICFTGVIPVGGYQFTNDISLTFNTPYQAAEAAKLNYAGTELQASFADQEISLPVIGREAAVRVSRLDICQLTRERAQELARMIKLLLSDAQLGDPSGISFVLTGGASNLPGLPALIQRTLAIPVRHGVPNVRGAIPDELKDPAYATSVGILVWVATEYVPRRNAIETNGNRTTEAASRNG